MECNIHTFKKKVQVHQQTCLVCEVIIFVTNYIFCFHLGLLFPYSTPLDKSHKCSLQNERIPNYWRSMVWERMGEGEGDRPQEENEKEREDKISKTAKWKNTEVNKPVTFCWLSRKPEIQVCYSACSKLVPFLSVYIYIYESNYKPHMCAF